MPVEIRVPTLGESVAEATIGAWLKKPGDNVTAGEPLVSLETDKVNVEIEAETSGVLGEIARAEGDTVGVGEILGTISENGAEAAPAPPAAAPAAGNGQTGEPPAASASTPAPPAAAPPAAATPVAQKIAEQNSVDLSQVRPRTPGGRITKDDVADYIEKREGTPATAQTKATETAPAAPPVAAPPPVAPPVAAAPPAPAPSRPAAPAPDGRATQADPREERVPMTRRRQTIARRLVEAQQTAAMLTTFNEVDMTAVMEIRKRRRDSFKERHGVGLGFMSFFTRATIGALKAYPLLNAEIQEGDGRAAPEIVLKRYYDIGVAVSTEEGLVVPVLRDADKKSFAQIEQGIVELATRAREGKLTIPELTGGTFTLTNGGIFGSLLSTPILNAPQVGILGMHKIEERPVAQNGQVVIRPMMYLALSYDHRIVDGREAVQFLVRVKELIEDPEALLLEG